MRILYALQGTGNGHVSRAWEILPHLEKMADVDVALSGNHSHVSLPRRIDYRFHGLGYAFGRRGGIDYWNSFKELKLRRLVGEVRSFKPDKYDLIINDFEPVTAWAARNSDVPTVSLSHQAAFLSDQTPRPAQRNKGVEWIFRHYAPCRYPVGFHFKRYASFIHTPVIRGEVRRLKLSNAGHFTVYLAAFDDEFLTRILQLIPDKQWHVFSRLARSGYTLGNARVSAITSETYLESLAACDGLLTGGGFEAPAEAIYLGKKLMVIPQRGQYEQLCNAEALRLMGVPIMHTLRQSDTGRIAEWARHSKPLQVDFPDQTREILTKLLDRVQRGQFEKLGTAA